VLFIISVLYLVGEKIDLCVIRIKTNFFHLQLLLVKKNTTFNTNNTIYYLYIRTLLNVLNVYIKVRFNGLCKFSIMIFKYVVKFTIVHFNGCLKIKVVTSPTKNANEGCRCFRISYTRSHKLVFVLNYFDKILNSLN
jgi:hypothetical protein